MHKTPSGFWIYFSPDNLLAAMIDPDRRIVYFIMERYSQVCIYENKEELKAASLRIRLGAAANPAGGRRVV